MTTDTDRIEELAELVMWLDGQAIQERNQRKPSDLDDWRENQARWLNEHAENLRSLSAELAGLRRLNHDHPKLLAFFEKHAIGSKNAPSCFFCGIAGERATTHLELPDIYVCKNCSELRQVRESFEWIWIHLEHTIATLASHLPENVPPYLKSRLEGK